MRNNRAMTSFLAIAVLLAGCGGGGGGGATAGSTPPTPPTSSTCSLEGRQQWAGAQLREFYLFPETLPAGLSTAGYATVQTYIDALTATARAQGRDRFFTYLTSIAEENAFFNSGSSAGFGIRLSIDTGARRVIIAEAFENAPALNAGIDRATEILAIGDTPSSLRTVSDIIAVEGAAGITNALGPSTAGVARSLQISDAGGVRTLTVTKADYALLPVSTRYGTKIINDGGRQVAYLNLRTFISTADAQLRNAFAQWRAQGITDFIIDFRYNGGGLVSTAELIGDLLGANRSASDIFSNTTFRPEKASNNSIKRFSPTSQSVAPARIAFIGTAATASASELVINAMIPFLGANEALVGANTFGKPVGQIALDRAACDDRLRVVAFSTQNATGGGFYYTGLASVMPRTCAAPDDVTRPLGDAAEASVARALDFLAGRACGSTIAAEGKVAQGEGGKRKLLTPDQPTVAQREVPGLF